MDIGDKVIWHRYTKHDSPATVIGFAKNGYVVIRLDEPDRYSRAAPCRKVKPSGLRPAVLAGVIGKGEL